jgi:ABC-type polar amino acid transport system ATPase subunit
VTQVAGHVSGGQQKSVAITRALTFNPSVNAVVAHIVGAAEPLRQGDAR